MKYFLRYLFWVEEVIDKSRGRKRNNWQKKHKKQVVPRCFEQVAMQQCMKGALRATAWAIEAGGKIKWAGRKKMMQRRIEIKIQQRSEDRY